MVCACGGATRDSDRTSEGSGGANPSNSGANAGGVGAVPQTSSTIGGVPVGDCREPTSEMLAAEGCPARAPVEGAACETATAVKRCAYGVEAADGQSSQLFSFCREGSRFWTSHRLLCGRLCPELGPQLIEVPQSRACSERAVTTCGVTSVVELDTQQYRLDNAFERTLYDCGAASYATSFLLQLEDGCPVRLSSEAALPPEVSACLVGTLSTARWDCGVGLVCGLYFIAPN